MVEKWWETGSREAVALPESKLVADIKLFRRGRGVLGARTVELLRQAESLRAAWGIQLDADPAVVMRQIQDHFEQLAARLPVGDNSQLIFRVTFNLEPEAQRETLDARRRWLMEKLQREDKTIRDREDQVIALAASRLEPPSNQDKNNSVSAEQAATHTNSTLFEKISLPPGLTESAFDQVIVSPRDSAFIVESNLDGWHWEGVDTRVEVMGSEYTSAVEFHDIVATSDRVSEIGLLFESVPLEDGTAAFYHGREGFKLSDNLGYCPKYFGVALRTGEKFNFMHHGLIVGSVNAYTFTPTNRCDRLRITLILREPEAFPPEVWFVSGLSPQLVRDYARSCWVTIRGRPQHRITPDNFPIMQYCKQLSPGIRFDGGTLFDATFFKLKPGFSYGFIWTRYDDMRHVRFLVPKRHNPHPRPQRTDESGDDSRVSGDAE